MIGTLNIKARPLKLGYLVDPANAQQVRAAIQLSSSLWGGDFFPIIPLYNRMPSTWRQGNVKPPAAHKVILGYIEAFDPDILVQFSKEVPEYVQKLGLEIVTPAEVWAGLTESGGLSPKYGIGVFEILNELFDSHFKFKPKYPVEIVLPQMPRSMGLFWASWFGEFPDDLMPVLKKHYFEPLDIHTIKLELSSLGRLLSGATFFPRKITRHKISSRGRTHRRSGYVYFMDGSKVEDVIDFWNLRAVGEPVFPVPKQLKDDSHMREALIAYLRLQRRHWTHNKSVCDVASLVRSRNTTFEEMQSYAKTLTIPRPDNDPSADGFFMLQHWYPRIWDEWARDKDSAVPRELDTGIESSIDIGDSKDHRIRFRSLLPSFANKYGYHGEPRCANDVSLRVYGANDLIAEVFPQSGGAAYSRVIAGFASLRGEWRVGRVGLVKLVKRDFSETRDIPSSESLFFAWLKDLGWDAKPSSSGILARQIYKKFDGYVGSLRNEKLLGLLEHMNGGTVQRNFSPASRENEITQDRTLAVGHVKNVLKDEYRTDLHEYLLAKGIFRLVLSLKCPTCTRTSWYPLPEMRDELICPKCLNTFAAIGNLDKSEWCYKTAGAFSVPKYAEGAYAVLLTANFFSDHRMSTTLRTTPALSFVAKSSGKKDLEADYAAFWEGGVSGESQRGILFAECKTYNSFEQKDFDRMRYMAENFPGAILVFSTLRRTLTAKEVRELTRITKAGRKYWKSERPINPVLILTGAELLGEHAPPYCWPDAIQDKFRHTHNLIHLADATQQIYLGLPSWQTEWYENWEKRDQRRLARNAKKPPKVSH